MTGSRPLDDYKNNYDEIAALCSQFYEFDRITGKTQLYAFPEESAAHELYPLSPQMRG